MRKIYGKIYVAMVLSVSVLNAHANLPEQYRFSVLDIHSGLTHNQVHCFFKDQMGYVWIGTAAGLNRFDGSELKVFRHDAYDSTSINGNIVTAIFEGPEEKVWVNTSNGLNIYNAEKETFDRGWEIFLKQYGLPGNSIEHIFKDSKGRYWFIQTGYGITQYNPSIRVSTTFEQASSENEIASNHVSDIQEDNQGNIWLIHRNGTLEKLDRESLEVKEQYDYFYQRHNQQPFSYKFLIDSDDDLWVYLPSDSHGLFYFDYQEKEFIHFHQHAPKLKISTNLVKGVVEESNGIVWVGTDLGGINVINKDDLSITQILHNSENKHSLIHNSIYALYKDREGIIWVGAYKNGVNYYHKNIIRFKYYKNYASIPESLPYADVNCFAEDDKGNLWIGTNGGGLLYMDRITGRFTQYKHDPNDKNSISSNVIVSLLVGEDKSLWIGTYLGGLNRFDGHKFTCYRGEASNADGHTSDNIWELMKDSRGNIWIGTVSNGLVMFDPSAKSFHQYKAGNDTNAIKNSYVVTICEDQSGKIWIGGNAGVDVIDRSSGRIINFQNDPQNPSSLISNRVLWIYNDSRNNIWIATEEGLALFDENTEGFIHYTEKDGLPHHAILTILEDDNHNLWLSTPNGLTNLLLNPEGNIQEIKIMNYHESDGLQGMTFNENAAAKLKSGELVFGGATGFNIFNPKSLMKNTLTPKVVFTDFQLFNKSLRVGERLKGDVVLSKSIAATDHITLAHNQNFFSIGFSAISFFQPHKNKYKYRLIGFDEDWHEVENSSKRVTYTNLDPGEYELRILASNNDGVWADKEKVLSITVMAPFWKTPEAYGLYFVFILLCLYTGRRMMLERERAKFQIEQERREAKQMHELDLMKIRFFTNVSHEFRTPLSLILTPIEKLLGQAGEDDANKKQYVVIQRNARRLLNLVNQLLDFRKIEVDGIVLHPSEGNVIKFIEESVYSFSDLSEKKNISLSFHSDVRDLYASFDMDKLEKILFNLLSNAFKFTPENGNIKVEVSCVPIEDDHGQPKEAKVVIKVKDDGIGVPKENQGRIFERFFRNDMPKSLVNQGSGIGLSITKEFVRIHGGEITVESEVNKGSCFTVILPLKTVEVVKETEVSCAIEDTTAYLTQSKAKPIATRKTTKILLVEDNEDFRFYLKDNLGVHYEVIEARHGKEGWQRLLSHMPELIICDLMMPEMNGIELCKKVKSDPRSSHIPFIMLTAHAGEESKLKGINIGVNDYMTKPFNFEILLSRIRNLISERQHLQKVLEKKISVETSAVDIVSADDKLIQDAIKIVEANLEETELSVEMLSKELGMSRANLYKRMVALTGQSPVAFIRKIRLQRAAQYLEKSQLTVSEIAYKVGFNSTKYFTKYFKKEFNMLPSAYTARHRKKRQEEMA